MSGNSGVEFECGLSQNVSDGLHVLLEVLQLLVDHCAEDAPDLGLLHTQRKDSLWSGPAPPGGCGQFQGGKHVVALT